MAGAGTLGDNIGLNEDVIKKACAVAFEADKSTTPYVTKKIRGASEAVNVVAFPASWAVSDWFVSKPFGATEIDVKQFPSLRSVGNVEAALVNEAFLGRFEFVSSNSLLKDEVTKAIRQGKQLVFTGHSSGAAVAILATFWALEEYLKLNKNLNHKPPFCVTFGSPLVGNHIFSHATRRENWSSNFIHFVLRFDIVPRILLAPFSSIENIFGTILQLLAPKTKHSTLDPIRKASLTSEFYSTVMKNAANVTSSAACNLMGSTNLLLETMTNFVELSPYKPFGTFVFCTRNGQLVVIRNSDAVFQLLFHSALPNDLQEFPDVANKSILQHPNCYEDELKESLEMQSVVYLDQLEGIPLSADGSNSDISKALDDLGLSTRARLCLRAAGELQKQKRTNEEKIKMEIQKAEASTNELKEYKATCETHKGYYDAFKEQDYERDFKANVNRLVVAGVWDELIEMLKRYELPDEFEGKPYWIKLGTGFRRLLEPLDIANYYRHSRDKDGKQYMASGGRPKRYRYTQRWLEYSQGRRVEETYSESCFWAEVEELCKIKISFNDGSFENVKERIVRLEAQIMTWNNEENKDVLLEGSTLVKWWKALPEQHKKESCIRSLIEAKT